MFDAIVNLLLTGLFLQAQNNLIVSTTANNLPVAEMKAAPVPQRNYDSDSLGVKVNAQSYLAVEPQSGKILYENGCHDVRSIASITKLMTALVFLDHNPGWDGDFTMSSADYRNGGITYLIAGDRIKIRDLFFASLVASSNEATAALARSTGLSEESFVAAMNQKAAELGMADSRFADPTGLDNDNKSTAEDVVKLAAAAFSRPEISSAASTKKYEISVSNKGKVRKIESTDKILGEEFGIAGNTYTISLGKTGFLDAAGYCFVSQVHDQNGREVLIAVLGSPTINDRFQDTKALAYWVFNNYKW